MKITIVAFEGCMTSAVYGQAAAFAIAAYIAGRRADASWSGHDVRIATPAGLPVQGYGGHTIEPHCSLTEAGDSNVVLIPPIFNDIEATLKQHRHCSPLAVQAALAQAQTWADGGDAAAFAHSVPDIIRLLNSRDATEAMRAMAEGRAPKFLGQ
jgi:transcriptional regulator GlxA family with amidase domain